MAFRTSDRLKNAALLLERIVVTDAACASHEGAERREGSGNCRSGKKEGRFAVGNGLLLAGSEWRAARKAPRNQLTAGLEKAARNLWESDA